MSAVDMSPEAITGRLRQMSDSTDLSSDRLGSKIDMSPEAVTRRLRKQSDLRDDCLAWMRIGQSNRVDDT